MHLSIGKLNHDVALVAPVILRFYLCLLSTQCPLSSGRRCGGNKQCGRQCPVETIERCRGSSCALYPSAQHYLLPHTFIYQRTFCFSPFLNMKETTSKQDHASIHSPIHISGTSFSSQAYDYLFCFLSLTATNAISNSQRKHTRLLAAGVHVTYSILLPAARYHYM